LEPGLNVNFLAQNVCHFLKLEMSAFLGQWVYRWG